MDQTLCESMGTGAGCSPADGDGRPASRNQVSPGQADLVNLSPSGRLFSPRNAIVSRTQGQSLLPTGHTTTAVSKLVLVRKACISFLLL